MQQKTMFNFFTYLRSESYGRPKHLKICVLAWWKAHNLLRNPPWIFVRLTSNKNCDYVCVYIELFEFLDLCTQLLFEYLYPFGVYLLYVQLYEYLYLCIHTFIWVFTISFKPNSIEKLKVIVQVNEYLYKYLIF